MPGSPAPASALLRVVVAGSGVAALEAALALRALARELVRIELLSPRAEFVHAPLSVLTPFTGAPAPRGAGAPRVDLSVLERLGIPRRPGSVLGVDPERRTVLTTTDGELAYDRLVLATGAAPREAVANATTLWGAGTGDSAEAALLRAERRRDDATLIVAIPDGATWPLPGYELALMAAERSSGRYPVAIVTPELRPLEVFGSIASDAVARLLDAAGIRFEGGCVADAVTDDALVMRDGRLLPCGEVIALPTLQARRPDGIPGDADGFVAIDEHARVLGLTDVFAAGDMTSGRVKHGGLAAAQADAAARMIAAQAGVAIEPRPYEPVLRGLLLTGGRPLYLRANLADGHTVTEWLDLPGPAVSRSPLWWPPGKVAGRHLASFVAEHGAPGQPLSDAAPATPAGEERRTAYELLVRMADQDAGAGDFAHALESLASAATVLRAPLPPQLEARRAAWQHELHRVAHRAGALS